MNREEIELLASQVRRLSLELPIQDAEFQSVVDANIGKKNAVNKVEQAYLAIASERDSLIHNLRLAIAKGSNLGSVMSASRKLAESLNGGLDSPSPLTFIFDAIVELKELAERSKSGSRVQPDSEVTKWVRKNWHKYGHNKTRAVKAFMEINGKSGERMFNSLYDQLNNDCRKNPLTKPKKGK